MTLDRFHPAVASWFAANLGAPTACQEQAWEALAAGRHTLIAAPTGSGKTLAGFLTAIDALVRDSRRAPLPDATRVLYVSPLKALGNDVHKNLEVPLEGIDRALVEAGEPGSGIRAMVRTGDTPSAARQAMRRQPPHILVTTPESLYILLTSEGGRAMLASVGTAIVDEIHAVAGNKRGAHLALSLERLDALAGRPVTRIGLSATQRPIETVAHFLTGCEDGKPGTCTIVDTGHTRERDLALELPESPLEAVMSGEVWAEVYRRLCTLIEAHRTTLVFVNTRRMAERVARALTESLGEENVTSHHGSLSRERRLAAEQRLKAGDLKALVATASLELGIDIGDVDLVCQLGSTRSISTFLQRAGRSGHAVHGTPKGRLFPLTRDELVECAAILDAVQRGELDTLHVPVHPLDVLAQQVVAMVAAEDWSEEVLLATVHRAWPYRDLAPERWRQLLAMLAGGFATRRGRRSAYLQPRRRQRRAARPARRPPHRDDLGRCDPRQRRLRRRAGAPRNLPRLAQRGLRHREPARRHLPARQHVVAHPAGRARLGPGGGRARAAPEPAVLARRGAGAHRRALRQRVRSARVAGAAIRDRRRRGDRPGGPDPVRARARGA